MYGGYIVMEKSAVIPPARKVFVVLSLPEINGRREGLCGTGQTNE